MPSGDAEAVVEPENTGVSLESLTAKFNSIVRRAKAALVWERAWPRIVPPLAVSGVFASATWLGAWHHLPPEGRIAGAVLSAAAFLAAPFLWKTKSLNVTRDEAIQRIETVTGTTNRQAQTVGGRLTQWSSASDQEIFDAHRGDVWDEWGDKFKAGTPHPGVPARDPYHIRHAIAVLTLVAAGVAAANHNLTGNLTEMFNRDFWHRPAVVAAVTPIDFKAWVEPPEGISDPPPIYLDTKDSGQGGDALPVHKNSKLTVLTFESDVAVTINGQDIPTKALGEKDKNQTKPTFQHEITLPEGDATVSVSKAGGQRLTWHFKVLPDNSPTVSIDSVGKDEKDPNALNLNYKRKDDYGVTGSTVTIAPSATPDPAAKPLPSSKLPEIKIQ